MSEDRSAASREERRRDAEARVAAFERRRAAESERARQLLAEFVADARRRGLSPEQLTARPYDGRGRYRTGLTGWYLRRNRTLGVDTDGQFYILTVPPSLRGRLVGVTVSPEDPPLVVGAGGRDGDSIAMEELLRLRLAAGDDWA